jgi:hypothetical protein
VRASQIESGCGADCRSLQKALLNHTAHPFQFWISFRSWHRFLDASFRLDVSQA